jgi:hypothetical protein
VAQTFFGPWHLTATTGKSHFSEQFVIDGSDGADGIYVPLEDETMPTVLDVNGARWTIDFQARFSEEDWFSYDPIRTTRYMQHQGLTVWLSSAAILKGVDDVFAHLLIVECISRDPTLSPPPGHPPFDFSLPKG